MLCGLGRDSSRHRVHRSESPRRHGRSFAEPLHPCRSGIRRHAPPLRHGPRNPLRRSSTTRLSAAVVKQRQLHRKSGATLRASALPTASPNPSGTPPSPTPSPGPGHLEETQEPSKDQSVFPRRSRRFPRHGLSRQDTLTRTPVDELLPVNTILDEIGISRAASYRRAHPPPGPRSHRFPNGQLRFCRGNLDASLDAMEVAQWSGSAPYASLAVKERDIS